MVGPRDFAGSTQGVHSVTAYKLLCNATNDNPGAWCFTKSDYFQGFTFIVREASRGKGKTKSVKTKKCTCASTTLVFTMNCAVVACDLFIAMIQRCPSASGISWPACWCSFFTEDTTNVDLDLAWHVAASACEACDTITVTFCTSDIATGHLYQIRGGKVACAPQVSASATTGTSTAPDSPSITACGCVTDCYLAISFAGGDGTITDPACGFPCGYEETTTVFTTAGCDFWSLSAYTKFNGITENPGAYTISASKNWAAITVLVEPLCAESCCCSSCFAFVAPGNWLRII